VLLDNSARKALFQARQDVDPQACQVKQLLVLFFIELGQLLKGKPIENKQLILSSSNLLVLTLKLLLKSGGYGPIQT